MTTRRALQKQGGMVLVEGLVAIVIFALGVLAIVGMQAATVRQATDAKYRVDASFLVNQAIGMMWSDRANLADYAVEEEEVGALPNGKRTIAVDGTQVTVTVTWQMPGESTVHSHSSMTRIDG
jgi:type IV pilus assembly protein PilV